MRQKTTLLVGVAATVSVAALVALAGSLTAQEQSVGLTGATHTDDVIMARQLLMDGIDDAMHDIDISTTGADLKLETLKTNANTINMLMSAFPHLFPPADQTHAGGRWLSEHDVGATRGLAEFRSLLRHVTSGSRGRLRGESGRGHAAVRGAGQETAGGL
jgi:hypothetical protein